MSIFKLKGIAQNYSWGGKQFIPELIGENSTDKPVAEYWLGAHDRAPSVDEESGKSLLDIINNAPTNFLGEKVYNNFKRLPYLFKVLDVQNMLSIQVHPNKKEAEKGFARENNEGVPLDATFRNYKDDNHKPEIMVALSEFWLLHGFLPESELRSNLKRVPELRHLLYNFNTNSYKGLYEHVMFESQSKTDSVLKGLIDRLLNSDKVWGKASPEYWTLKAFDSFCKNGKMDKGIYSIFFFNIVKVNPGEAIFQDAGIPHAYLEGQNMELMANSDNVLRGGLTYKYVDVEELLKQIHFTPTHPKILRGLKVNGGVEKVYKSPAPDFELSSLEINTGLEYKCESHGFEIFIILDGQVEVKSNDIIMLAQKGDAIAVPFDTRYSLNALEKCRIYKAKCPVLNEYIL